MLKEFIQHIQETTQPLVREIDGATFVITAGGDAMQVRSTMDHPSTLSLNSLDSLVKMIQTEARSLSDNQRLYITVPSHLRVDCFSSPLRDARCFRPFFYQVSAPDVPGWDAKMQLPFEEAQIALRTRFQHTGDTDYALKLLSDITTGAKVTFNDNGVATTIVTQKGISLQGNETIRPIVSLRPYRTFQEVEQPASEFLIRINERNISFIEADGGMWKLHARETIKAFLEDKLATEIAGSGLSIAL